MRPREAMANRRSRRRGRPQTLLPLHASPTPTPNSVSCWYCDFKIYALNEAVFSLGRRYARFLKVWFTVGAAFSFVTMIGVSMMLLWGTIGAFNLHQENSRVNDLLWSSLFGTSSLLSNWSISVMDATSMIASTLLAVGLHEFGHALAAACEGLQIEYIAIFLALLFPGALVAFNNDWLQSLSHFASLRIYCAGIWHNVTLCAACVLIFLSLPMILHPLYIHGEGPLVLGVPKASPFYGYLSPYDIVVAVDGSNIKSPHEWINIMAEVNSQMLAQIYETRDTQNSQVLNHRKGYCVPDNWTEASSISNSCSDEFTAFVRLPCSNSSLVIESLGGENKLEDKHCLIAKEVVKLKKCWNGWQMNGTDGTICECAEDESCMAPVQIPGMSWVEITYSSPYSAECLKNNRNSSAYDENLNLGPTSCGGTFVYVGDVLSVAHLVHLSAYQPRWPSIIFMAHIPNLLEKLFSCCFHVSASLALVNSLPVSHIQSTCSPDAKTFDVKVLLPVALIEKISLSCIYMLALPAYVAFWMTFYVV
ncbi:Peptidase family M50 [Musa troglodytarum]|uniref:Endopeptidase S2P n=2 Tax=Musa troglodytarum TaxID=320322 RepID=A0A9E7K5Y8_9LILI|nr:Peptidase family M50 [Musa troglodytarum]